jgi:type I restriction enzyme S subunit
MKTSVIRSSWLAEYSHRLDCMPYVSGALEAKILLEELPLRKDPLHTLTKGFDGGIYNGPQFVRNYVESPEQGVPFMTGSTMQLADLFNLPLLSKRDAQGPKLRHLELQPGMSLISCSGSIGNMAYARPEMKGIWSSQDVLKVVADPDKIPSGYLYAYLCSKFGVPLLVSGTYGSIIQHLEAHQIAGLPVPRLGDAIEHEIHALVEQAAELRTKATLGIHDARRKLQEHFGEPPIIKPGTRHPNWAGHAISSKRVAEIGRLDTLFFNPLSCDLDDWLANHPAGSKALGEIAEVFDVPPFKHIYVGPEEGPAFFTSADLFDLDRKTDKYLSRGQTRGLDKYVLEEGWVLIARSGQLNGNIGLAQFVDSGMAETTASDHVIRIVPHDDGFSPGYLYAYLSLPQWRYSLIQRSATGASIPALWPVYLNHVRILRPPAKLNKEVDAQVRKSLEMRVAATRLDTEARNRLEAALKESAN